MNPRSPLRATALALAALALVAGAACGDDDVETSTGADDVTEEPDTDDDAPLGDGGGAAGTCLEGTPDCQDTPMDPDQPLSGPDDDFPSDQARDDARATLGTAEDELGPEIRIRRRGSESMMLTEDYVLGRITVELDDDGTGTFVVTSATVELPDGPETFEA